MTQHCAKIDIRDGGGESVYSMDNHDITRLLSDWEQGDPKALDALTPLVYAELRQIAKRAFRGERPGHTLQPTALVHEAFAKLADADIEWQNRKHFYALISRTMRRILVNHAEAKKAQKRGGGNMAVTLHEDVVPGAAPSDQVLALHEALQEFERFDPKKAKTLELHYFGGLTYDELSKVVGRSTSSLERDLLAAKAWIKQFIRTQDDTGG